MKHPCQQITLQDYIETVNSCNERVQMLTEQIRQLSEQSRLYPVIKALQSMRGISLIVAATTVSELGDICRFEHPDDLMGYLGLIPSENSSGDKQRRGSITKAGNGHVRKALITAAQAYRLPARKTREIQKRQEGVPKKIQDIAWKAQIRLCNRYRHLIGKGKHTNVAKTAVARELCGFIWAIAKEQPLAI
jgi:transposase